MHCLVTGGAGFIGGHLVHRLAARRHHRIRVFDNLSRSPAGMTNVDGVEFINGDLRNVTAVRRAVAGCQTVFHLAAQATVMGCEESPVEAHEVNVTGTYNLLRIAREAGVQRFVMASSREVYGEVGNLPVCESAPIRPKNVYGATKAAGEMYCSWASSAVEITVLRLANVFGPGDTDRVIPRFLAVAAAGEPLVVYGGEQILDFVWINTAVDAFIRAGFGLHVPGFVNIGSGIGITITETARRVIKACRSTSDLAVLPARQAEVSKFVADITRMKKDLGICVSPEPLCELAAMCELRQSRTAEPQGMQNHAHARN